jgi:cytochrome b561
MPPSTAPFALFAQDARYTRTAIGLHWLLALLIVGAFGVGLYMTGLPISPRKLAIYTWHKWAGITILALSALRLAWRLTHRPPRDLPMPGWQRIAAHAAHLALYALFFAVPLLGWAYSSAAGRPVVLYGLIPLPDLVPVDRELAPVLRNWHEGLNWLLAAIVALHVAGALKHRFIDRDSLWSRMGLGGGRA